VGYIFDILHSFPPHPISPSTSNLSPLISLSATFPLSKGQGRNVGFFPPSLSSGSISPRLLNTCLKPLVRVTPRATSGYDTPLVPSKIFPSLRSDFFQTVIPPLYVPLFERQTLMPFFIVRILIYVELCAQPHPFTVPPPRSHSNTSCTPSPPFFGQAVLISSAPTSPPRD